MTKLLNENFHRYQKATATWVGLIVLVFLTLLGLAVMNTDGDINDAWLFNQTLVIFSDYALTAIVGVFISRDYKYRTINNKLSVGHTRTSIYLSNLISSIVLSLIALVIYITVALVIGIPMFGLNICSAKAAVISFLFIILITAAKVSFIVLITMSIKGGLGLAAAYGIQYSITFVVTLAAESMEEKTNQFIVEFLPFNQTVFLSFSEIYDRLWLITLYSVIFLAVTTVGGICIFNKSELK